MPSFVRAPKDFWIGLVYLIVGAAGLILGRGLAFGTGARMGPGYFPMVLAALLVAFGAVAIIRSFLVEGGPVEPIAWRSVALVTAATAAFALALERLGLVLAIAILALVSALASDRFALGWRPLLGLGVLIAVCAGVFARLLGLPMPLVGTWLTGLLSAFPV